MGHKDPSIKQAIEAKSTVLRDPSREHHSVPGNTVYRRSIQNSKDQLDVGTDGFVDGATTIMSVRHICIHYKIIGLQWLDAS